MQVTMHSHTFHLFIIALVVLDALIVLFELLLDLGAFSTYVCVCVYILDVCTYAFTCRQRCC